MDRSGVHRAGGRDQGVVKKVLIEKVERSVSVRGHFDREG